ncbi:MAG: GntR family transcriptional regulator [Pseudomonadota bacterium]
MTRDIVQLPRLKAGHPKARAEPTTHQVVAQNLSRAIHEHRLVPGLKLGEDELADIYNVSRTIVRTALQTLSHERLVDIKRHRGAFVACPAPKEAQEVFEARELLEPRTARSAALKATREDVAQLKAHIEKEHAAMDAGDKGYALYLSGQLHVEIARIAAQDTITSFIESLIARSSLVVALYWRRESALCESHAHDRLVEAIRANDPAEAEALMKSHLVDLHSALDLNTSPRSNGPLRDMLLGR